MGEEKDNFFWIILLTVAVYGIFNLFKKDDESIQIMQKHPSYEVYKETKDCGVLEPRNIYSEGTGHYAGFEWGKNGNFCNGNSESFIKGCQEYQIQDEAYTACVNR